MSAAAADLALVLLLVFAAALFVLARLFGRKRSVPACGKPPQAAQPQVIVGARLARALDQNRKERR